MIERVPCGSCGRSFKTQEGRDHHVRVVHSHQNDGGALVCRECGSKFKSVLNLKKHKDRFHSKPPIDRRPTLAEAVRPTCIECGKEGQLVTGREIYPHRPDLYSKRFYLCECGAYCGCHPNSVVPLGFPCGPATRRARNAAHAAFDPIWRSKQMTRASAYKWLADVLSIDPAVCHIGMMNEAQALATVAAVQAREGRT
jgi:hypothetical protein